jgi:hypothetical protein
MKIARATLWFVNPCCQLKCDWFLKKKKVRLNKMIVASSCELHPLRFFCCTCMIVSKRSHGFTLDANDKIIRTADHDHVVLDDADAAAVAFAVVGG